MLHNKVLKWKQLKHTDKLKNLGSIALKNSGAFLLKGSLASLMGGLGMM